MAKRTSLNYDTRALTENLKQSSGKGVNALFSSSSVPPATAAEQAESILPEAKSFPHSPAPARNREKSMIKKVGAGGKKERVLTNKNVSIQENKKKILQEGETWPIEDRVLTDLASAALTNHSYRYSLKELNFIRDIVYEAEVKYQTKLGKGEVLRMALLWLMNDYQERGEESILVRILMRKKARK